jgi:pimeloyl-ACP methyl ester carboxylesterase
MKTLFTLAVSLLSIACASARAPLAFNPCEVAGRAATCGKVPVPENRALPGARTIELNVAIVKAPSAERDPLVVLAGGPGQGAVEIAGLVVPELATLMQSRDLLLVDQRGTGASNRLSCSGGFEVFERSQPELLQRCLDELKAHADVTQYTTDVAADDLRHVLDALGYDRVNLVGASYGTRAGFVFMRRYPNRVRTAVMRAVAPPGFNILVDGTRNAARQLEGVIAACAADEKCSRAFPKLREEVAALRTRLERESVQAGDVRVTNLLLQQTIYALLLTANTRQTLPALLHNAASGDFTRLAPVMKQIESALYGAIPIGMYLSVVCSEDAPGVTATDRAEMAHAFGATGSDMIDACAAWPRGPVAKELSDVRPLDIPTLLVSGEADPATPEDAGAAAMKQLTRGTHVVARATAHGPMFPGCVRDSVTRFVKSGGSAPIDVACALELQWPPFVVPQ